jgi:diguanylate cyclase (GGDEF)-like protein
MKWPKLPLVTLSLKKRLWAIIVLVTAYLVYIALGDLIPKYWSMIGFRSFERSVLTLGFVVVLLIALSGLAASDRLAARAIKDGLTGLFNQTYIKSRLQEEIYRSERYKYPLSLTMIDLDDFKSVNDRHGHVGGDHVLKGFSDLLLESIRASDIAGRFGGEEFLVILPETSCLDAASAAERFRKAVAVYPFRVGADSDRTCQFTISLGVYSSPASGQSVEEIITLTDAALYRAKKEGKNKVVVVVR